MQKYDFTVFIGRFQPFHAGHLAVVEEALAKSEQLIIVVGSKDKPRSPRNPLTYIERVKLIRSALTEEQNGCVLITGVQDYEYNLQKWISEVQRAVFTQSQTTWRAGPTKIALIGHSKDHTSYYLNLFPKWNRIDVNAIETLDGTALRALLHAGLYDSVGRIRMAHIDTGTRMTDEWYDVLDKLYDGPMAKNSLANRMMEHSRWLREYKHRYGKGPFITSDALVLQSGYILLIKRGPGDGEGQWALPGGFMNPYERLQDAGIRELREETGLKVPEAVLRGSIKKEKTYDDPWRSERARLITHAVMIELANGPLPKVKGSDDAKEARWFTLSEFYDMRDVMFEDHYSMICNLIGE